MVTVTGALNFAKLAEPSIKPAVVPTKVLTRPVGVILRIKLLFLSAT